MKITKRQLKSIIRNVLYENVTNYEMSDDFKKHLEKIRDGQEKHLKKNQEKHLKIVNIHM